MRVSIDVGGTFTDLVVEYEDGHYSYYKSPTTPDAPIQGIIDVIDVAAHGMGKSRKDLLGFVDTFIHATTRSLNAILSDSITRTAFLTTEGHPDILFLREGGRASFNPRLPYPRPYIPRSFVYEIPERIGVKGDIVKPLNEKETMKVIEKLNTEKVEAVAVCFLWSIINPKHELRVGELIHKYLPGIPYTLSHKLNPSIREYRRASSTAIDASLKPIMSSYIHDLEERLHQEGFCGRLLLVSSIGGLLDSSTVESMPIHTINSGPAMAPVAGRYFAQLEAESGSIVVTDTGGTSFDVSLVNNGRIPWTREAWIGRPHSGLMTGFPSVDVKNIGAGGGSIGWVDNGGLLHTGPKSAGAHPGPVCYGRGGKEPTVTDAALVLGYIDPDFFLGGSIKLDLEAAKIAIDKYIGKKINLNVEEAALGIMRVMKEQIVQTVEEITVNNGIDPRNTTMIAGGGAAGLNIVSIARQLGCARVIIPETGAVLSAFGALKSDLTADFRATFRTDSVEFNYKGVNKILKDLEEKCNKFILGPGAYSKGSQVLFFVEAHYLGEVWELEVPWRYTSLSRPEDVLRLLKDFHVMHERIYSFCDPYSPIEIIGWRARVLCHLEQSENFIFQVLPKEKDLGDYRTIMFPIVGFIDAKIRLFHSMSLGEVVNGPAIIASPFTNVVIDPGASAYRTRNGSLYININVEAKANEVYHDKSILDI